MQTTLEPTSYDEVPYESRPFVQTHPDRLATLGRLFGLPSVPITQCRVLELGCAGGGNLIPMAMQLPQSRFVGLDLSKRHVEEGRDVIEDLELKNIRIEHGNITDVDTKWGVFDYIICHGVYSWVPDDIQDKILTVSKENLNENGIAYISYNTYPGWHMREMIRHMMLFHANQFTDSKERVEQARALMQFLESSVPTANNYYGLLLKSEFELIKRSHDWYLFHDHLEEINAPVYFYQFIERAENHGLQYLAEADFSTMLASGFPEKVAETLNRISPHIVNTEQYMDFLRQRTFRQTLLCHKDRRLKRNVEADDISGFWFASPATPDHGKVDLRPDVKQQFHTSSGAKAETNYPLTKAALQTLSKGWPGAMDLNQLIDAATKACEGASTSTNEANPFDVIVLLDDLLYCYANNVVEFHTWQADFVTKISDKPLASKLAIYQATNGPLVVNQRHELVKLDPVSHKLVKILDGESDHSKIVDHLISLAANGDLALEENGQNLTEAQKIKNTLEVTVEKLLPTLASSALLVE